MADDRVDNGDPAGDVPEASGALRPPDKRESKHTLAYELTEVVDSVRTLYADFGLRPYRVFLVHGKWPGARRGYGGALQVVSRREIVPVPRVRDVGAVTRQIQALGNTEIGDIVIDQISARYTEDDLMGRTPDMVDPTSPRTLLPNVQFWWEVEECRDQRPNTVVRRYSGPVRVPELNRGATSWRVTLTKQDQDRSRDGATLPLNA